MPEDPDDRGPQHTGEVSPQPDEPAWKKRKPGETNPVWPEKDSRRPQKEAPKKTDEEEA